MHEWVPRLKAQEAKAKRERTFHRIDEMEAERFAELQRKTGEGAAVKKIFLKDIWTPEFIGRVLGELASDREKYTLRSTDLVKHRIHKMVVRGLKSGSGKSSWEHAFELAGLNYTDFRDRAGAHGREERRKKLQDAVVADIRTRYTRLGGGSLSYAAVKRDDQALEVRARYAFGENGWRKALEAAGLAGMLSPETPLRPPPIERAFPPKGHVFLEDEISPNVTHGDLLASSDTGFEASDAHLALERVLENAKRHGHLENSMSKLLERIVHEHYEPEPHEFEKLVTAIQSSRGLAALLQ